MWMGLVWFIYYLFLGMPPNKVVCPSKPLVMGPEIFFKVDNNTR